VNNINIRFEMENQKKDNLFEEQLRKIKYYTNYKISESPRYRPLVGDNEEFDNLPTEIYNAGQKEPVPTSPTLSEQEPPQPPPGAPPASGGAPPVAPPAPDDQSLGAEAPEGDELPSKISSSGVKTPAEIPGTDPMGTDPMATDPMGSTQPAQQVDDIQNDIIKHNIAAMKSIHDKLNTLDTVTQELNNRLASLNADVEEVREPTNTEKLINKTNVSYPYYFNLNDLWSDNWFSQKRTSENEKGVREMPDGSFVADFDDLPQNSKIDVQNSFTDY
jgi:hypothetical protein